MPGSPVAQLSGPQDPSQFNATLNQIINTLNSNTTVAQSAVFTAPIAADLTTIKAAATPVNGGITIAAQPDYPRKLQVRIVLGTPGTTDITAGALTLVGITPDGQPVTEVLSLVTGASVTLTTANAYAHLTSGTVASYAANGSGTGNTLGIGPATAMGLPLPVNFSGLNVFKTNVDNANEAVGTVDTVAGTIIPTTAANGTHSYEVWYSYNWAV